MSATLLAIMNAMYGGLGQSVGAIVGGKAQQVFGTVKAFRGGAAVDAVAVVAASIYFFCRKKIGGGDQKRKR